MLLSRDRQRIIESGSREKGDAIFPGAIFLFTKVVGIYRFCAERFRVKDKEAIEAPKSSPKWRLIR